MFYDHWKKIALSLTAFFWASCDNSPNEAPMYGAPPCDSSHCMDAPESSDASGAQSSSSSEFFNPPVYGDEPVFGESSSSEVTCVPMDSSVVYFAEDYSADTKKMWKEEEAKHDAVDKIDSITPTLAETPLCLEQLRMELDMFVALYGAPTIINNAVDSCSDGTIRPSEEYARFLKMKEEWEANKPALEEELKKVYEDKMKEIEKRINKCLSGEADE